VKTYDVYNGTLTIKHLSSTSNTDYDLREFELTKTERKVCSRTGIAVVQSEM